MKVIDILKDSEGKTRFSFEILPPKKGEDIKALFASIDPLMEFNPAFIDVTYHREEYEYRKRPDGLMEKVTTRKRPGTVGICAAIINRYKIDAIPHLICGGFTKEETENALIDLAFLGIENILALRGDAIKAEGKFIPTPGGNEYASDLIEQIQEMNAGVYQDKTLESTARTNFSIGVAAYPEKHFEAPNMNAELHFLKKKVQLGAEYAVTQMFFDNDKYFRYLELCKSAGIEVPIIPGLKPIATKAQLKVLPSIFHIDIPEELTKEVLKCKDNTQVKEVGIEWSIQQCKELIKKGVPCLHFYTMSRSETTYKIAKALF